MVVLYVACLPLNAILTLLGVRFCVRNKVDVPTAKQLALENPHMKIDVIKEENTDEKNKDTDENGEAQKSPLMIDKKKGNKRNKVEVPKSDNPDKGKRGCCSCFSRKQPPIQDKGSDSDASTALLKDNDVTTTAINEGDKDREDKLLQNYNEDLEESHQIDRFGQ